MNDEYLWQRTGKDPEIEKLEKALAVFRYREPLAPTAAAIERLPRWRISLAFAFASLFAVSIAGVAWLQMSGEKNKSENTPEVVFVAGPEIPATNSHILSEPTTPEIRTIEPPARRSSGSEKINATRASERRRPKAKDGAPKDNFASLTEEEKYAYRQLMLALSITGSKLKIVQNTIDGTEEPEDTDSNNKR